MKCVLILLSLTAAAFALPYTPNGNSVTIRDGEIIITKPDGRQIKIAKELDNGNLRNLDISIGNNQATVKTSSNLDEAKEEALRFKRSSKDSKKSKTEADILAEIFKEYQGVVDEKSFEKVLNKIAGYVETGELDWTIYEVLKTFAQYEAQAQLTKPDQRLALLQNYLNKQGLYGLRQSGVQYSKVNPFLYGNVGLYNEGAYQVPQYGVYGDSWQKTRGYSGPLVRNQVTPFQQYPQQELAQAQWLQSQANPIQQQQQLTGQVQQQVHPWNQVEKQQQLTGQVQQQVYPWNQVEKQQQLVNSQQGLAQQPMGLLKRQLVGEYLPWTRIQQLDQVYQPQQGIVQRQLAQPQYQANQIQQQVYPWNQVQKQEQPLGLIKRQVVEDLPWTRIQQLNNEYQVYQPQQGQWTLPQQQWLLNGQQWTKQPQQWNEESVQPGQQWGYYGQQWTLPQGVEQQQSYYPWSQVYQFKSYKPSFLQRLASLPLQQYPVNGQVVY